MKLPLLYTLDELRCAFDCDNIITDFHAWHNKRFKCNPGELRDRNRKQRVLKPSIKKIDNR